MKKVLIGLTLLSLGLASCGKEKKSEIKVLSPEQGKTYTSPLPLNVKISNNNNPIHDIEIKVYQKNNPDLVIFDYDNHVEVNEYEVKDSLFVNVSSPTQFVLEIEVGEEVETHKNLEFTINP